jgi:predicted nucleotidyltransferase
LDRAPAFEAEGHWREVRETMSRSEVLDSLSRHLPEMRRRFGVSTLALFGSLARDEARAGSDVDILADFPGPPSFDQYVGLKLFLEDLLRREVDLVTRRGLREQIRPRVEREAVSVP